MLKMSLDNISNILNSEFGNSVDNVKFNPGLTRLEIDNKIQEINISIPEEIYDLYMWRNGLKDRCTFFPGYEFPSLEDIICNYKMLREIDRGENEFWKSGWLPIFTTETYIFIDCNLTPSCIYYYDLHSGCTPTIISLNLTSMILSIAECYQKKVYVVESMGKFHLISEMDENAEAEIFIKHNPDIQYWKAKREMLIKEANENLLFLNDS